MEKFLRERISKEISETIELRIDGFIVFSPKGRELIIRYGEKLREYGGLVRRSVFDGKLMEIAESEGAELKEGKTVIRIEKAGEGVVVKTLDGDKYEARYVILANGVQDKLGEKVGLPPLRVEQLGACWALSIRMIWRKSSSFGAIEWLGLYSCFSALLLRVMDGFSRKRSI